MKKESSVFESTLKQNFKQKSIEELDDDKKKELRLKTIDEFFNTLSFKENRYIFYCPDIVVVNNLVETIYEIAYEMIEMGYNVVILHEIKGFQCKWLLDKYPQYKSIPTEFIIFKRSKKSRKETNKYSFKATDTFIVPDLFLDILESLGDVKLIQKIILVTGLLGISNLKLGTKFFDLGVNTLLFLNDNIEKCYDFFLDVQNKLSFTTYKIDRKLFNNQEQVKKYPVVSISAIGNKELLSQVINIFYNKYPKLALFSFKLIDRTSYDSFIESVNKSALFIDLDKSSSYNKQIHQVLNLGVPVVSYKKIESDKIISEEVEIITQDPFEIAEYIASYCQQWLTYSNSTYSSGISNILGNEITDSYYSNEKYKTELSKIVEFLQDSRIKFFASMKQTIEKNMNGI